MTEIKFNKKSFLLLLFFAMNIVASFSQPSANIKELKANSTNEIFSKLDQSVRSGGFSMKGYWVWCGSVVKGNDNQYHMFASRWPDSLLFHPGWMVASEIVHAVSDKAEGPFKFSEVALPARGAQFWDGRSTHNPQILRHKNKYVLVYMGSTHPFEDPTVDEFENRTDWTPEIQNNRKKIMSLALKSKWAIVARNNKRIGIAIADSPFGPWKRFDTPALNVKPNTFYSFLTSNPTAVINEDGSLLMMFKGRGYKGNQHGHMSLGIAKADSISGKFVVLNDDKPIFNVEEQGEAEDPFMWRDNRGYHVIFKDQRSKYTQEIGGGVLAHSNDGIKWFIDKDPKAYSRTVEWTDGTIETLGQMERPFILFEDGKPVCLYNATMRGGYGFENGTESWNMVTKFKK
jgi:hypothetical protein